MSRALRILCAASALFGLTSAACEENAAVQSPDQAHLAQQASEPRANDPTAAAAAPETAATKTDPAPAPAAASTRAKPAADEEPPADNGEPRSIIARHVLVQWYGCDRAGANIMRTRDQALAVIEEVQKKAKAGQDLGRLAVEYSDEPGAGARHGSLGRFRRGQMVPEFDVVAFKLRVGEISGIVETPFGFHIIQRLE